MTGSAGDPGKPESFPADLWRRIDEIDQAYVGMLQRGETPDRASLLSANPDIARWLEEHFDVLDALHAKRSSGGVNGRKPTDESQTGSGRARPERVGSYQIRDLLGEGGMGVVYLAEQTAPTHRRVAVKLVKPGMDSRDLIARFESERHALALMDHPGIARVLEAGATETGRPYFVMEYVPGLPITEYCDRERLTTQRRLHLFSEICDTVQHAHQKGIIHRDLKPSNILVTEMSGRPLPKIIDFGVAKAMGAGLADGTVRTEYGRVLGTVEYMSPEQAEGRVEDVDARTDIYSLGVILYELLTGVLPFDTTELRSAGIDEVRRRISTEDPPKPSTQLGRLGDASTGVAERRSSVPEALTRMVQGDLDWITMRAMDKDATRRYASASELAADIARHLRDEPVLAGPPTAIYRAKKFVRKHRTLVAAALVAIVSIVAGLVASTTLYLRAGAERDAAEQARQAEEGLREEAQRQARRAEAISRSLQRVLASVDPSMRGRRVELADLLDRAVEEIDAAPPEDSLVEASLRRTIGRSYAVLGMYEPAEKHMKSASEIQRRVLGAEDPDAIETMVEWGEMLLQRGRTTEAESTFRKGLEVQRRDLGGRHPSTMSTLHHLAWTLHGRGRFSEAEALFRQALAARRLVLGEGHEDTLDTTCRLSLLLQDRGKLTEAEVLSRKVLEANRSERGDDHRSTLIAINHLAIVLSRQGRFPEAEALLVEARSGYRRVLGEDHPDTMMSAGNLAVVWMDQGRYAEAEPLLRGVLAGMRRGRGREHPDTLAAVNNLANLLRERGSLGEAEELYREALEAKRRSLGEEHPGTLRSMGSMASLMELQGRFEEAESLDREALEAKRRILGEEHPETLGSMNNLGGRLLARGRTKEAEPLIRRAVEGQRRLLGDDHPSTLRSTGNLALLLGAQGRWAEAVPLSRRLVESRRRVFGPDHPATLGSMDGLAWVLKARGDYEEAERVRRDLLEALRRVLGEEHLSTLTSMAELAGLLLIQGKFDEAEPLLLRALEKRRRLLGDDHPDTLRSMGYLATLLASRGRLDEAEGRIRRTIDAQRRLLGDRHPDVLTSMALLASVLQDRGDLASADRLWRRVVGVARATGPKGDWLAAYYCGCHGSCLVEMGRYHEAEDRLLRGYTELRDAVGPSDKRTLEMLHGIVDLYGAWSKPGKAEEYRAQLSASDGSPQGD